jgi:DNA-binding response OmpR family regulator
VNVLVVEDDVQWACVLAAIASFDSGAIVHTAHSMREGWAQMAAQAFDVLLLDLTLPDSTPDQTLGAIRTMKHLSATSVIVITSSDTTPEFVAAVKERGADDCIGKNASTVRDRVLASLVGAAIPD